MANIPKIRLVKEKTDVYYDGRKSINNPNALHEIGKQILKEYIEEDREAFAVILLDTKLKSIGYYVASTGTLNETLVHPREIFKKAIVASAKSIMLLHNHPTGDTSPSNEDMHTTNRLVEAGRLVGIEVLDHLIVGNGYYSFKERGIL